MEIRDYADLVQRHIFWLGYWEPRETLLFKRLLRPGDVVIDAGANVGWFTLLAAALVGVQGHVYAIEPWIPNIRHLRSNIVLNRFTNVDIIEAALDSSAGRADFGVPWDSGSGSLLAANHPRKQVVTTCKLDDILGEMAAGQRIRLLKIDIQGTEARAFAGAARSLREHQIENILVEAGEVMSLQMLRDYGYRLYRVGFRRGAELKSIDTVRSWENVLAVS
jgi:FkbM family methyltransferase